ncbi:MAG: type II secretion system protein [Armatimonadetes bacterium]|nr:type II secretion system protein [Armatimonadota bacterium]
MKYGMRRRHRGITLIELIVVMGLMIIMIFALGYGFTGGLDLQRVSAKRREEYSAMEGVDRRITHLLQSAFLSATANDTSSFFIGEMDEGGKSEDIGCDRLVFTTIAPSIPMASLESADDFETQHRSRGPIGGLSEVSYGTRAIGTPKGNQSGLFERVQTPSDADNTQGGMESLLSSQVQKIGFQFWNGTDWVAEWDTTVAGQRRLPASVKVTYTLNTATGSSGSDNSILHVFIVPLFTSDVTADNPVTTTTSLTR